jgi:hypothetical protein
LLFPQDKAANAPGLTLMYSVAQIPDIEGLSFSLSSLVTDDL